GQSRKTGYRMIYSTGDVHPRERLSYWLEVATRGYVEHDFRADDAGAFSGRVESSALPGISMATFDASAARACRSEGSAARAARGRLCASLTPSGRAIYTPDGQETTLRGRGMVLIAPQRPFEIHLRQFCSSVVVRVPRAMLEARIGNLAGLTARP